MFKVFETMNIPNSNPCLAWIITSSNCLLSLIHILTNEKNDINLYLINVAIIFHDIMDTVKYIFKNTNNCPKKSKVKVF